MVVVRRSTLVRLGLLVFGLTFVAFLLRGFGQFVVGARAATLVAGPVALLAGAVLVAVVGLWLLARLGVVDVEESPPTGRRR